MDLYHILLTCYVNVHLRYMQKKSNPIHMFYRYQWFKLKNDELVSKEAPSDGTSIYNAHTLQETHSNILPFQ